MKPFTETDCTYTHEGKSFSANGAHCDGERIIAYLGKHGALQTWHGETIGQYRIVASWMIPGGCQNMMSQVEATIDGVIFTGRSCGEGMIFKGKRKAK